ncbi:MAG TPA: T9SS type A sorting domain-containing protein, partial [Bacteroidia bacterium]|nr:T9SS type A sorting domain-containing protein [Bacteroidia bacterium]
KKHITLTIALLISYSSNAQWQWAKQIGGINGDGGGIRVDANDNIYCSGDFGSNCFLDNDTLWGNGYNDLFLIKYNTSGNELWSKSFGGNNTSNNIESGGILAIDNTNNCLYYSGAFYGSITIDAFNITSSGGLDIFIAKFDLSGNCIWLKKAGSPFDDRPAASTLDANGNIYFTGVLGNNGTFETYSLNKGTFLSMLDPSGNILWAQYQFEGGSPSKLIVVNSAILMCGFTNNDTLIIDATNFIGNDNIDCFLAKTDLNGNIITAKRFGGKRSQYASDFEIDSNGDIYLNGFFDDSLSVDATTLSNNGKYDFFLGRFDSNFNSQWIRQSNATGNAGAKSNNIIKDIDGKFYISGQFSGNASFGSFNVSTSNPNDYFIARFDDGGGCIGVRHFGFAVAARSEIDNNGDIIVSGTFSNTINIGSTFLTSHGGGDMFFAKSDAIVGIGGREINPNNQLIIYANPTQGKCNITVPDDFVNENNLTLSIYDNTGKLIQQKILEMNDGKIKVSLEQEAKGIYNVTLANKKKSYSGKIIFE